MPVNDVMKVAGRKRLTFLIRKGEQLEHSNIEKKPNYYRHQEMNEVRELDRKRKGTSRPSMLTLRTTKSRKLTEHDTGTQAIHPSGSDASELLSHIRATRKQSWRLPIASTTETFSAMWNRWAPQLKHENQKNTAMNRGRTGELFRSYARTWKE